MSPPRDDWDLDGIRTEDGEDVSLLPGPAREEAAAEVEGARSQGAVGVMPVSGRMAEEDLVVGEGFRRTFKEEAPDVCVWNIERGES